MTFNSIAAIDPGPTQSAIAFLDGDTVRTVKDHNPNMLELVRGMTGEWTMVVERVEGFGMAVGAEVFETVWWSGRFAQAWREATGREAERLGRRAVKLHLCGTSRAKDANVRQALIDRFGPGKEAAIGRKKAPGPLWGVSGDGWAALAVGVTWADKVSAGTVAELAVSG